LFELNADLTANRDGSLIRLNKLHGLLLIAGVTNGKMSAVFID
jgi:hypothetical protein